MEFLSTSDKNHFSNIIFTSCFQSSISKLGDGGFIASWKISGNKTLIRLKMHWRQTRFFQQQPHISSVQIRTVKDCES